jgi:hypothetical protein
MSEMTPGELADRLDKDGMSVLHYTHYDVLCKSLRFAADMEVLTTDSTVRFTESRAGKVVCTCSAWNGSFEIRGEGTDIYSAARAAVEALEGRV